MTSLEKKAVVAVLFRKSSIVKAKGMCISSGWEILEEIGKKISDLPSTKMVLLNIHTIQPFVDELPRKMFSKFQICRK